MKSIQTLIASKLFLPPLLEKFVDDAFAWLFQRRQFHLDALQILKPRPDPQLAVLDMKDQIFARLHAHLLAHRSGNNEASAFAKFDALAFCRNPKRCLPSAGIEPSLRIFVKPGLSRSVRHDLPFARSMSYL
nr:hypothetical protein [Mesorhizobium metallidurans]